MKSITFNQALLAVGLVGLTLPLTIGQPGITYIVSAYSYEGGPSPVGPIVALAATLAVAMVILATGLLRMRAGDESEDTLSYPQLLVTIGLLGLLFAGACSPMSLVFSIVTGWDETSWWTSTNAGPLALQLAAFAIPLLVIGSSWKGARRGPSVPGEAVVRPFTCLAVLTLVTAGSGAPSMVMRALPHSFFSGRYGAEDFGAPNLLTSVEIGVAPELAGFALVALAIPIAVLLLLRFKEDALRSGLAGPLLVTAALLATSGGFAGVLLMLLFGIPIAALLWPHFTGRWPVNPPSRLNTGQLLAWVALICLAITTAPTLGFVFSFTYSEWSDFKPFPGPATALALAYAISLAIFAVATAKLRSEQEIETA